MLAVKHPEFPSDLLTCFAAAGCTLHLVSETAKRMVSMADWAAASAKGTALGDTEIIQSISIPLYPKSTTK
jgi:CO/xanthine dehydrogenase FAD-binding subunit